MNTLNTVNNYLVPIVKKSKRVGRGISSGRGKTAGRGGKGQTARTGGGTRPDFEGGQTRAFIRFPKRGKFKPSFKTSYRIINLIDLESNKKIAKGQKITLPGVKILSNGNLTKSLIIQAAACSKEAQKKITQAGGSFEKIEHKK